MTEKSVQYYCKILPFGNWISIIIATNLGLGITFIGFYLNLPVFVILALMLGVMYAVIYLMSTNATFTINDLQLNRTLEKKSFLFDKMQHKDYSWQEINSFKNGKDKGRYRGEFQFLEIYFKDGKSWKFTDMYGERKDSFDVFKTAFLEKVNAWNQQKNSISAPNASTTISDFENNKMPENPNYIIRKKTFYETFLAKIITLFFVVFVAGIITFFIMNPGYIRWTSLFKLFIILIPGVMYMVYRTFYSKKNE